LQRPVSAGWSIVVINEERQRRYLPIHRTFAENVERSILSAS
jgi:hypothetical protein